MRGIAAAIALVELSAVIAQSQRPPSQGVFHGRTDAVSVDVSVEVRNAPVAGLGSRDFVLLDNGVQQQVGLQTVENVPLDVSLVLDGSHAALAGVGRRFPKDVVEILEELHPKDRLEVITFATDVRVVLETQPADVWGAALHTGGRASLDLASLLQMGQPDDRGLDARHDPALRQESLFDAVLLAMSRPVELGRRHLVVAFAVGNNTGVVRDGALFARAAACTDGVLHVALWNRRILNGVAETPPLQYARTSLAAATLLTGGAMHAAEDVSRAFRSILADFRQGYVLTYTLTGVAAPGWHTITVKVPAHPEYTVRARSGYLGQ